MNRDDRIDTLMRQATEFRSRNEWYEAMGKLKEAMALLEAARKERFNEVLGGLGERVLAARKAAGVSQSEVAETLGVDPSYISLIETGRRHPSMSKLRELAVALSVSADTLLGIPPRNADEPS